MYGDEESGESCVICKMGGAWGEGGMSFLNLHSHQAFVLYIGKRKLCKSILLYGVSLMGRRGRSGWGRTR